jgi:hypothetical protein
MTHHPKIECPDIQNAHLTDEQFADLLLGLQSASLQAHLDCCPECAHEAARVCGAISYFNTQSRLWSERRAATRPALTPNSQQAFPWLHRPQVWMATTLAIALAAAIGFTVRNDHNQAAAMQSGVTQSTVAEAVTAAQVSPATLKADNDLLSAIDGELRTDESSTESTYQLTATPREARTKAAKRATDE